jgi:hypothetical protein
MTACPAASVAGAHSKGDDFDMSYLRPEGDKSNSFAQRLGRRRLVRTGGLLAGAAALVAAPVVARAEDDLAGEATFDVALDGTTVRYVKAAPGHPSGLPMTGDTFILFGSIFPAGTFDAGNLNPDQSGAIGRWICRGSFYVDLTTDAVPHAVTTVLHVLGEGLSAAGGPIGSGHDAICHQGFEGGLPESTRAIVGGTGRYAGVQGDVFQLARGENDTVIQVTPEIAVPAPSYTFTFRFKR